MRFTLARVAVQYFLHNRSYLDTFLHSLNRVTGSIKLRLLSSQEIDSLGTNHEYEVVYIPGSINYRQKLDNAIEADEEYTIKVDDDLFLPPSTLQFLIDHVHWLDSKDIFCIVPLITNSVPLCEEFIKQFWGFGSYEQKMLYQLFGLSSFYGFRQEKLLTPWAKGSNRWKPESFYRHLKYLKDEEIAHRIAHPLHRNIEAQQVMNWLILRDWNRFYYCQPHQVRCMPKYLWANSCFAIKTRRWKEVIGKHSNHGQFDQVPMNKEFLSNTEHVLYPQEGYCLHARYKVGPNKLKNYYGLNEDKYIKLESEIFNQIRMLLP